MAARRRRSSVTVLVVLLVVLAVLVGAFLVGDRYAERRAEREATSRLQTELGTPTAPSVDVQGWPFLTQVAASKLSTVHVVADDVGADGSTEVPVAHTDLVLSDVTSADGYQTLDAAKVEGTARLDYPALSTLAGVPLSSAGGGRVQIDRSVQVFGADVAARVTGTPQLDVAGQTLNLADPEITVGGVTIPGGTSAALAQSVLKPIAVQGLPFGLTATSLTAVKPIAVQGLPFGLTATSLTAGDDGVDVGVLGRDVQLQR